MLISDNLIYLKKKLADRICERVQDIKLFDQRNIAVPPLNNNGRIPCKELYYSIYEEENDDIILHIKRNYCGIPKFFQFPKLTTIGQLISELKTLYNIQKNFYIFQENGSFADNNATLEQCKFDNSKVKIWVGESLIVNITLLNPLNTEDENVTQVIGRFEFSATETVASLKEFILNENRQFHNLQLFTETSFLDDKKQLASYPLDRECKIYCVEMSNKLDLTIISKISTGKFADIYLGKINSFNRDCEVLKYRQNISDFNNFKNSKYEVITRLKLPYTTGSPFVELINMYTENEKLCIVTEYMTGGSLKSRLSASLGVAEINKYCRQILKGLQFLHGEKIIHRNINCESVLIDGNGNAKLTNFYLSKFLFNCTTDMLLSGITVELRMILEDNRDPVSKILGDRFSTVSGEDSSIYRYADEIINAGTEKDSPEIIEKKKVFKMSLEFHNFDVRLMRDMLGKIAETVRVNPKLVENEIDLLVKFSGPHKDKSALISIEPVPIYKFIHENGCRAPPWRQLHGEISYFIVRFHSKNEICVTASSTGWFVNNGPQADSMFARKDDKIYSDLISLLKQEDEHFSSFINTADLKESYNQTRSDLRLSGDADNDYSRSTADQDSVDGGRNKTVKMKVNQGSKHTWKESQKDKLKVSKKWEILQINNLNEEETTRRLKYYENRKSETRHSNRNSDSLKKKLDNRENENMSESSSESEEDEDSPDRRQETSDMSSEYWQIQKLVKYLKGGNQTSTIISLCALRDLPLHTENCQLAIRDVGGLEVLINLLETDEVRCKIGSLKILKEISHNPLIRRAIADLGGLNTMVNILKDPNRDLKCLSAETIANVAKFRRARRTVRHYGGIKKLVGLLDCPNLTGPANSQAQPADIERDIEVARCVALALWSCSKSKKNKEAMKKAGIISLLSKLLKSNHVNMLIPIVGTLQECASEKSYRIAIRTEGMIEDLVKNLKSSNKELEMHCAATIFKCAEEKEIRDLVRHYGGLEPLVALLQQQDNKELLAAVTGAIWKCAISQENVKKFQELQAIEKLVTLLNDQPEEVLVNVVGALGEMAKDPPNRAVIRKTGGITPLVNLLTGTNQALLVNTTKSVGRCAEEPDSMSIIDKQDGVRLLWSLLKNPNPEVQANAAWAICPCIENAKDAGEMVRSFVGGLELIVSLLKSEYIEVLASVCAAIGKIAMDEENLAVITDHGVVPLLARLTTTTDDLLRCQLAEAISRCCNWGTNRIDFGKTGAVAPLVKYLKSSDESVHRSTAKALYQLSKQPENCVTMHEAGVVKLLLGLVGSADEQLQEQLPVALQISDGWRSPMKNLNRNF